jgi:hypothetical protein
VVGVLNGVEGVLITDQSPYELELTVTYDGETFEVVVRQYRIPNSLLQMIDFQRITDGTVGFNHFLREFLVERLRNFGIMRPNGEVVPRVFHPIPLL